MIRKAIDWDKSLPRLVVMSSSNSYHISLSLLRGVIEDGLNDCNDIRPILWKEFHLYGKATKDGPYTASKAFNSAIYEGRVRNDGSMFDVIGKAYFMQEVVRNVRSLI